MRFNSAFKGLTFDRKFYVNYIKILLLFFGEKSCYLKLLDALSDLFNPVSYIKQEHTSAAHILIFSFLLFVSRHVAPTEIPHDATVSANLKITVTLRLSLF
jgi:hypothetical protein